MLIRTAEGWECCGLRRWSLNAVPIHSLLISPPDFRGYRVGACRSDTTPEEALLHFGGYEVCG